MKGSAKVLSQSRPIPPSEKTGYEKADSTPVVNKDNLELVADIPPDTSQSDKKSREKTRILISWLMQRKLNSKLLC